MSKSDAALQLGRDLVKSQSALDHTAPAKLLAAGLAEGFDPESNPLDARINDLLNRSHGRPWQERWKGTPPERMYTKSEAEDLQAAVVAGATKEMAYNATYDRLIESESFYRRPPETATIAQLHSFARLHDEAERAFLAAKEELEKALSLITDIKVRAQERRRREAMATMELHHQPQGD